jgi:ABC-type Fe3+/spermidine/putrescine transport system ATPase subunit
VTVTSSKDDRAEVRLAGETVRVLAAGNGTSITVRPEKVKLSSEENAPAGSLSALVQEVVYIGTDTRYVLTLKDGQTLTARIQNGSGTDWREYARGEKVNVHWAEDDARILNE